MILHLYQHKLLKAKMYKVLAKISIQILLVFLPYLTFSQVIRKFTAVPEEFQKEIEIFLIASNKEKGLELAGKFQQAWKHQKFTLDQQRTIMQTANQMLIKRMKAFPDFENYLLALINFFNSDLPKSVFDNWEKVVEQLLQGSNRDFATFIETSNNLFIDNTIYSSESKIWKSSNSNYIFSYDSVPKINFPKTNLSCHSRGDSSNLKNTQGTYYPINKLWEGIGGTITWERAGLSPDVVFVQLKNYTISLNKSEFSIDSVVFFHKKQFSTPIEGRLTEGLRADVTPEKALYPKFDSYDKKIIIPNIASNLKLEGGFSMSGAKVISRGSKADKATLSFYKDNLLFIKVNAIEFSIDENKIFADDAEISIYLDKDSLYHPSLQFKYDITDLQLALIRKGSGDFYDSYHKVNMNFEALYWNLGKPVMDMKMLAGKGTVAGLVTSENYFNGAQYSKWQGIADYNPINMIGKYCKKNNTDEFYTEELAKFMKLEPSAIRPLLVELADEGFLYYDYRTEIIKVYPKLFFNIQANAAKVDYDAILLPSLVQNTTNASIDLNTLNLKLRGLTHFYVSDSQDVLMIPKNQEITIKKDRNIEFDGEIITSRFDFYGKNFLFNYQEFKVYLDNIDSLKIKVPTGQNDKDGHPLMTYVHSVVEKLTGYIEIDHPENKSGKKKKDHGDYPKFTSTTDSYVFYDKYNIQNGLYKRDRFYFHLEPFAIDSLETFNTSALELKGSLYSAGIFPKIEETLKIQPDFSLGFETQTPQEGYPCYGGKGNYFAQINLSNKGLRGNGRLDYLTSTAQSYDFLFLPDSVNANTYLYDIKKGILNNTKYPSVSANNTSMHWVPYHDSMYVYKQKIPMQIFDGEVVLQGDLVLSPKELSGSGIAQMEDSEYESKYIVFDNHSYSADTAEFRLSSVEVGKLAFLAKNLNGTIDLDKRLGVFKSNNLKSSTIVFPYNDYIGSFKGFRWEMDKKNLGFETPAADIEDSYFTSIHPKQDSLRFAAPKATYSLVDYIIYAEQVPFILVADATIYPYKGLVDVEKSAKMRTLNNSNITANTSTKYHNIYEATVNVLGRKRYRGSGKYDYVDKSNIKQTIYFHEVDVDTALQTYAIGEIKEAMNFSLNPKFMYKGDVKLSAPQEHLFFEGFVKLQHNHYAVATDWFNLSEEVNPKTMYININEPYNVKKEPLYVGMHLSQKPKAEGDPLQYIYSTFIYGKKDKNDHDIILVNGLVSYDKETNQFRIGNKEKILNNAKTGNYMSFNDKTDSVYAEGRMNLGLDLGQVKYETVGSMLYLINFNSTEMDVVFTLDFFFSQDAIKMLTDNILETAFDKPDVRYARSIFEKCLVELVGTKKGEKLIGELSLNGAFDKVPSDLEHTITFTDLQMKWNPETESFLSVGALGIGFIGEKQINKKIKGYLELVSKDEDDILNLYIEPSNGLWYFFSYQDGIMQAISSNEQFNETIKLIKPKKRKSQKVEGVPYQFIISSNKRKTDFLERISVPE